MSKNKENKTESIAQAYFNWVLFAPFGLLGLIGVVFMIWNNSINIIGGTLSGVFLFIFTVQFIRFIRAKKHIKSK